MTEKTKAESLAFTLNFLIKEGHVPGLLPEKVAEAATMLVEQEKQLASLNAALATKDHIVTVEVTERHYRKEIRGEFVITDPRIYFGEITVDAFMVEGGDPRWVEHVTRSLVSVATRDWLRDIEAKTYVALRRALARIEAFGHDRETGRDGEATKAGKAPKSSRNHSDTRIA